MHLEQALKKYGITKEEFNETYKFIEKLYFSRENIAPVDNPVAIIIGGQTGAGKTSMIGYSQKAFKRGNCIIINSDELKPLYPNSDEIAKECTDYYTKITDQATNNWTAMLFDHAMGIQRNRDEFGNIIKADESIEKDLPRYNLIFEGTMKNERIIGTINLLKEQGYTVIVRALAVPEMESRLSILERYREQYKMKGWGRLVIPEHHNETYTNMPLTVQSIEKKGAYDILEIYQRANIFGDSPVIVYSAHNGEVDIDKNSNIAKRANQFSPVSESTFKFGYINAFEAIQGGRKVSEKYTINTVEQRIQSLVNEQNSMGALATEREAVLRYLNDFRNELQPKKKDDEVAKNR